MLNGLVVSVRAKCRAGRKSGMTEMAEIAEMAESKKQKKGCRDYSSIIGERSKPLSGHVNGSSRYTYTYIKKLSLHMR